MRILKPLKRMVSVKVRRPALYLYGAGPVWARAKFMVNDFISEDFLSIS